MNYMDENVSCKDYIKLKSKPRLVSRFRFTVNGKSMENLEAQFTRYLWPPIFGFQHYVTAFCSFSLLAEIKTIFFSLWERLIALYKSRYYCHVSKMQMPNSLGL